MNLQRRRRRLEELLKRLQQNKHVTPRDLKYALTSEQFQNFQSQWDSQKEIRSQFKDKPDSIKEYEAFLKRALFLDNRAEHASLKRGQKKLNNAGKTTAVNLREQSETAFERALEHLDEIITADPGLCIWFDREVIFAMGHSPTLDAPSMPRVVTSRSLENSGTNMMVKKRQLKIDTVEDALRTLGADEEQKNIDIQARMKRMKALASKNT